MTLYASAGERVYGTRTKTKRAWKDGVEIDLIEVSDFHACTVRHDLYLGELPDFPACLGDWQQANPPVTKQIITQVSGTAPDLTTSTTWVELGQHGGGESPVFGVEWNGESWWRPYEHEAGGDRASVHYDLRFRGADGTATWGMDRLKGSADGNVS